MSKFLQTDDVVGGDGGCDDMTGLASVEMHSNPSMSAEWILPMLKMMRVWSERMPSQNLGLLRHRHNGTGLGPHNAGKTRVCQKTTTTTTATTCENEFIAATDADVAVLKGAVKCIGNSACVLKNIGTAAAPVQECQCEEAYNTCRLTITPGSTPVKSCKAKIVEKSELGPKDAVCDYPEGKAICTDPDPKTGKCKCSGGLDAGTTKLTATCSYFPIFRDGILVPDMQDVCRKKTRTVEGLWFPVGFEARTNSMCYCSKGDAPCNNGPRLTCTSCLFVVTFLMVVLDGL